MKKILYAGIVLVLLIGLIYSINGISKDDSTVKIGGIFHLSGSGAFWGSGELNGAKLAVEEIDDLKIRLIVEDSKTDFPETANTIQKLANVDNVEYIIGPTWFGQVASPIAEELKILMISPSTGVVLEPSNYFFSLWSTERQEVIPVVKHMKENNVNDVAVVYSLNDWSESIKNIFLDEAKLNDLNVVKTFESNPNENDFRTVITKLDKLNVDAIYAPFAFYPSQGAFSKQMKELNINLKLYSSSGTENPILLESFPEIEGTIYPYPEKGPGEEKFNIKYQETYNEYPSPPAAYAYDSMMLLYQALNSGADNPEEVSEYLRELDNYQGISNVIDFDENGRINNKPHLIKTIKDGKFVEM